MFPVSDERFLSILLVPVCLRIPVYHFFSGVRLLVYGDCYCYLYILGVRRDVPEYVL